MLCQFEPYFMLICCGMSFGIVCTSVEPAYARNSLNFQALTAPLRLGRRLVMLWNHAAMLLTYQTRDSFGSIHFNCNC